MSRIAGLEVRDRILDVSRDLFIRYGYNGVSIRAIASASGTNVAHISYYFGSKHGLFEVIFAEAFEVLVARVFSVINSELSIMEMISPWVTVYYEVLLEYPQIPLFIINEINRNSDELVLKMRNRIPVGVYERLSIRMRESVESGLIRETCLEDFALNMLSLCIFPFSFSRIVMKMSDVSLSEYNSFLLQHKLYVIRCIEDSLRV